MDARNEQEASEAELERQKLLLQEELVDCDESASEYDDEEESDTENDEDDEEEEDAEDGCPVKRIRLDNASEEDQIPLENNDEEDSEMSDGESPDEPPLDQITQIKQEEDEKKKEKNVLKRMKRIPEYRGSEYVLPLPEGWIETIHDSGLPVYMDRRTRVISWSRPYQLKGKESYRRHSIPIGAIPCEHQRRMAEERQKNQVKLSGGIDQITVPTAKLNTLEELRQEVITPNELFDRAKQSFYIKELMVYRYKNWKAIRKDKEKELMEKAEREENKGELINVHNPFITVAAGCGNDGHRVKKRAYVLNTVGKTSVTILHEYVQKVLKGQMEYRYAEVKSSIKPYTAMCYLKMKSWKKDGDEGDGMTKKEEEPVLIGKGSGDSKKSAKCEAASNALKVFVPSLKIDDKNIVRGNIPDEKTVELFDLVSIEDPRVIEMSKKTGHLLPYMVLQEVERTNAAWGDKELTMETSQLGHQRHQVVLRMGTHESRVTCKNIRDDGRHRAAQQILQKTHPLINTWGAILRLYSSATNDDQMETKRVRDEVVRLAPNHHKGRDYCRNEAVLGALRSEMIRVNGRRGEIGIEREGGLKGTQLVLDLSDEEEEKMEMEEKREDEEKKKTLSTLPPHSIDL